MNKQTKANTAARKAAATKAAAKGTKQQQAIATQQTAAQQATSIHSRALLVWLTIRTWSARKYDRRVSLELCEQNGASSDGARVNKLLLPGDAASYKQLTSLATSLRAEHYAHTLAWSDEGWRLLPTANYTQYTDWLRTQQATFRSTLATFIADYPALRAQAAQLLGSKFYKPEDYPSAADIASRFELTAQFSPLPIAGDVRVDLDASAIADIERQIIDRTAAATKIAVSDAWSRLHDVVAKMHERLAVPDAIFRDTLIGNARELCDALSRLNVTNDQQLETMRARVAAELTTVDPDVLRDTPKVRADVAAKADAILAAMSGLYDSNVA